ncbi:MAG: 2OG-Fe(II) oxygenase [Boseongicola sp.]|nr:MAG: 2OG-Fe(II) oxygenase [Boseongicola sp.]
MEDLIDLDRYPLHQPNSEKYTTLVQRCKKQLDANGMFDLSGFFHDHTVKAAAEAVKPAMATSAFRHARTHNVYFKDTVDGLPADHPALQKVETVNHTLCADQFEDNPVITLYEWEPFATFLAATMGKPKLYPMDDPLSRVNIQATYDGEGLNWHFDRSEFTTTMLLQAADEGGELEYRSNLRTPEDPNYDGVAAVLHGEDPEVARIKLAPGTLNVFRGVNTIHRVVPVKGPNERLVTIFTFYERPGVVFTPKEQMGFYGRTAPSSVKSSRTLRH